MPNLHKLFSVVFFVLFSVLIAQTITSVQDGDWDDPSTWDTVFPATIPSSADNVIIAAGHTVTIPMAVTALMKNITINATLDASPFFTTLEVYGNWVNNGTFTTGSYNEVKFKGNTDQSVDPGGDEFNDILLNNTGSPGTNKIAIVDDIDINDELTFTSGTLDLTDGGNPTVKIGGDVTISNNAVWAKGIGTVTFDGSEQDFEDLNGSPNNIGNIVVD